MSTAHNYEPKYTVEDYLQWEGDWELWNGYPVAMSPSPQGKHSSLTFELGAILVNQLAEQKCKCRVVGEIDWIVSKATVVRPDVMVVCDGIPEGHVVTTPALVAEILSPATRVKDLGAKRDLYFEQRVPLYLVVDPKNSSVMVLAWSEEGWDEIPSIDDTVSFTIHDSCDIRLDLKWLFR